MCPLYVPKRVCSERNEIAPSESPCRVDPSPIEVNNLDRIATPESLYLYHLIAKCVYMARKPFAEGI